MTKQDENLEEKSFNEDELEDIMNEIENLEKEFNEEEAPAPKAKAKPAKVAPKPAPEEQHEEAPAKVVAMHSQSSHQSSHPAKMHLSVAGDMEISLEFGIHGQTVSLSVDPQEGLVITMEGGAKFCLPLANTSIAG
jgi:hypothetical protein